MTEDPTLSESKLHPFTSFCLLVFCFVPVCVSCGKEVAARYPSIALGYCGRVQRDLRECRESPSLSCQPPVAAHPRLQFMWQASLVLMWQARLVLMWQADHRPPPTQARRRVPWIQFASFGQECRSQDHGSSSPVTARRVIPRSSQLAAAVIWQASRPPPYLTSPWLCPVLCV